VCTLHIVCDSCGADLAFKTSTVLNMVCESNVRLIYGLRCVGIGCEGTNLVYDMNIPPPCNRYTSINRYRFENL
jgi:hypothetical protein